MPKDGPLIVGDVAGTAARPSQPQGAMSRRTLQWEVGIAAALITVGGYMMATSGLRGHQADPQPRPSSAAVPLPAEASLKETLTPTPANPVPAQQPQSGRVTYAFRREANGIPRNLNPWQEQRRMLEHGSPSPPRVPVEVASISARKMPPMLTQDAKRSWLVDLTLVNHTDQASPTPSVRLLFDDGTSVVLGPIAGFDEKTQLPMFDGSKGGQLEPQARRRFMFWADDSSPNDAKKPAHAELSIGRISISCAF
jgi:hypothetical protein